MGRLIRGLVAGGLAVTALGAVTVMQVRDADATARTANQCAAVRAIETTYAADRAAAATADPYLVVLGDSYAQGQYLDSPLDSFAYQVTDRPVLVDGSGGSGYVTPGPCKDARIIDRIDRALATAPDVLLIEAGLNDAGKSGVRDAVDEVLDRAATLSPTTRVVLVGAFTPPATDPAKVAAVTAEIQAAAAAHDVEFMNPSGWDIPTLADGVHPSPEGHELIGGRVATSLGLTAP